MDAGRFCEGGFAGDADEVLCGDEWEAGDECGDVGEDMGSTRVDGRRGCGVASLCEEAR